jgi:2,3-bisphosphoglycerate-independent phosphoglycerate mutase
MVGHTGVEPAIIKAIETLDECLGKAEVSILKVGGKMLITADHGNAEETFDLAINQPHTAHTLNPVPLILVGSKDTPLKKGRLCDIAPTILRLMDLPIPSEMTGTPLLS